MTEDLTLIKPDEEQTRALGSYLLDGLSIKEACILTGFPFPTLKALLREDSLLSEFIQKKEIEFKHKHLRQITSKPTDKNSQWILEKLRPGEFGSKVAPPSTANINIVNTIVKDIQQKGTSQDIAAWEDKVILTDSKVVAEPKHELIDW